MRMTCGLKTADFCHVIVLLVSVQAEVSPTALSGHKGVAGCVHQYCYCPEKKYYPYDDPRDFAYRIEVKENAPELLRRALSRAPVDIVGTGDYQPAEKKFGLSRRMLEVCLEFGFPVSVAAWAIEETEQDLGLIYRAMGRKGLENIGNVGPRLAAVIEALLHQWE